MVLVAVLIADRLYKTVIILLACKACAPFIYERTKERVCTACKRKIDKHEHMFVDSVNRRHNLGHNPRLIQNPPNKGGGVSAPNVDRRSSRYSKGAPTGILVSTAFDVD